MAIGQKAIDLAVEQFKGLLEEERINLDKAYLKSDGAFSVSVKVEFSMGDTVDDIGVKTDAGFTLEKIKKSSPRAYVNERQGALFRANGLGGNDG